MKKGGITPPGAGKRHRLAWPCAVAAAAFFIFLGTFANPLVHDDIAVIGQNPLVAEPGRALEAFSRDYWEPVEPAHGRDRLYRPLAIISLAMNHAADGLRPAGYRLVNIALHAVASLLLFWLGLRFGLSRKAAGAAALLFALHPVHTEAVNAVVARADLMAAAGVFGGLALLLGVALPKMTPADDPSGNTAPHGNAAPHGVALPAGLAGALCLFALLSKEIGVALPLVALIWRIWTLQKAKEGAGLARAPARNTLIAVCALALALALYLWMRYAALGMLTRPLPPSMLDNPLAQLSVGGRTLAALAVLGRCLWLLLWPWPLSLDYSFAQIPAEGAETFFWAAGGTLALIAWGYAAWRMRREMPWLGFGLALFIGGYLPVSNLAIPMGTIMAERTLYLPSAGFLIAAAPAAAALLSRYDGDRKTAAGLLAALCLCYGALTITRNHEWGDALRLWRRTAEVSPRSARAQRVYGQALTDRGRFREAITALKKSVAIYPSYDYAWVDLGIAQLKSGETEDAEISLARAIDINPQNAEAHVALGALHMGQGRRGRARPLFERAIRLNPSLAEPRFNLGTLYLGQGLRGLAIAQLRAAIRLSPLHGGAHHNLALALYLERDLPAARTHATRARRLGVPLDPRLTRALGLE